MSDDSFIREVDDELRQDTLKNLWQRYGVAVVGMAVAIVLATAGWTAWDYWRTGKANASGDLYSQALDLAAEGKLDEAGTILADLEKDGFGAYPVLARLRKATLLADQGDAAGAVAAFDAVAADTGAPMSLRDMANLRAAYLLVDHGSAADVAARAEPLASDTNPLRLPAREALALAAWKEGRAADALKLYLQIASDSAAPQNLKSRADMMAELIRGSGAGS